jgi:hypothetical protein
MSANAKVRIIFRQQEYVIVSDQHSCEARVSQFLEEHKLPSSLFPKIVSQIKAKFK